MKNFKQIVTVLAIVLVASIGIFAEDSKQDAKKESPKELKNQTHCPIMGGAIDSTAYTDIQGQRVYHCCPMCSKPLKADPDKYFKKAAEEGILFENIQATCPVSGMELEEKAVFTDFEGRRVYFCCEKCIGLFNNDPQKNLAIMDSPAKEKETDASHDQHGHEGHGH
jgi:YHS domain-containing protein